MEKVNALGRRKSAVARVYVGSGKGNITINGKELAVYFPDDSLKYIVMQPLTVTNTQANFDIVANLDGGGIKGQAEALRLAIARAGIPLRSEEGRIPFKRCKRGREKETWPAWCTQTLPVQQALVFAL